MAQPSILSGLHSLARHSVQCTVHSVQKAECSLTRNLLLQSVLALVFVLCTHNLTCCAAVLSAAGMMVWCSFARTPPTSKLSVLCIRHCHFHPKVLCPQGSMLSALPSMLSNLPSVLCALPSKLSHMPSVLHTLPSWLCSLSFVLSAP